MPRTRPARATASRPNRLRRTTAPGTHDRVELLIASLAAGGEHPGGGLTAWTQLRDLGLDAFPEIAEHLEDDGFAFRADSGTTYDNWTVGRACRDLLWCSLEPYNKALLMSSIPEGKVWWRPVYTTEFLTKSADAKAWLAEHRGKQLVDLQIEVLEWVTTHRSDRDAEISAEDKASLVELLDQLKATRKPLPPVVPWAQ